MSTEQEPADQPDGRQTGASSNAPPEAAQTTGTGPVGYQPSLEEIFQYLDGQLDEERQATLATHLHQCGGCDDLYNFQAGLKRLLGTRCRSELPADLPQRVFRAITDDLP